MWSVCGKIRHTRQQAAAVASAAVGTTSSPASESGFSKVADDTSASKQEGAQMDTLRGGAPGTGPTGGSIGGQHDKDNDVEGKLFIGGISWQTTEEGLRYVVIISYHVMHVISLNQAGLACMFLHGGENGTCCAVFAAE